ncbi:unnamed protein product [Rotaria sordida]|uniref:Nuclear receptor domain-containing protein n=1 Tax=Rotaria sordida TaxID=392033 RepID=A0A814EP42_9BILA|nr:unnamed protein product [Rotaria sordida]CAF0824379.1 unnamed protein product [Rotaria sordida]CAF0878051.1 unnamed protein product [Rotaria sordida]CAF0972125.1 unnamed protein product [Rotaria sordida]CAF1030867.1 unnamed protein product [Rotaria sordida]
MNNFHRRLESIRKRVFIMEESSSNKSIVKKRQSSPISTKCQICGAPAIYSFYSVISCNPYKIFFKRNAHQGQAN